MRDSGNHASEILKVSESEAEVQKDQSMSEAYQIRYDEVSVSLFIYSTSSFACEIQNFTGERVEGKSIRLLCSRVNE